jgi:hypothetical protein
VAGETPACLATSIKVERISEGLSNNDPIVPLRAAPIASIDGHGVPENDCF